MSCCALCPCKLLQGSPRRRQRAERWLVQFLCQMFVVSWTGRCIGLWCCWTRVHAWHKCSIALALAPMPAALPQMPRPVRLIACQTCNSFTPGLPTFPHLSKAPFIYPLPCHALPFVPEVPCPTILHPPSLPPSLRRRHQVPRPAAGGAGRARVGGQPLHNDRLRSALRLLTIRRYAGWLAVWMVAWLVACGRHMGRSVLRVACAE